MAFAALVVAGYKGPELYLKNKATKRTNEIRKGLPDALDLLVICAEAGLTVDAAFNRVAKELGRAYPELGDEFALTAIELSFLTERRQAFENLAYRVDLDAVRGVVTTMIQTERYGTPLASALRVLSAEFRNERMMRAEEKAARLPAIMTVPLILFILPVLFIVILGPAACSISDAFSARRHEPSQVAEPTEPGPSVRNRNPAGSAGGVSRSGQPEGRSSGARARSPAIDGFGVKSSTSVRTRPSSERKVSTSSSVKLANSRRSISSASGMICAVHLLPAVGQLEQVRAAVAGVGLAHDEAAFLEHLAGAIDRHLVHQGAAASGRAGSGCRNRRAPP